MCNTEKIFSFTKRSRLSRLDNFSKLLKQRAQSNQWFAVYCQLNQSGCARLGLAVSKRLISGAVQRNTVKRKIRECFRAINRDGVGRDIVVKLRAHPEKVDQITAYSMLSEILRKIIVRE